MAAQTHSVFTTNPRAGSLLRRALETARIWTQRSRQRRALAQLNSRELRDVGITRHDALRESAKPFWRA